MSNSIDKIDQPPAIGAEIADDLRDRLHQREAICTSLEQLSATATGDYTAQIAKLTAEFEALPALPPEYAEILEKRFAQAVKDAQDAAAAREQKLAAWQTAYAELTKAVDVLVAAGDLITSDEVEAQEVKWQQLKATADDVETDSSEIEEKLQQLKAKLEAEAAAEREKAEKAIKLAEELTALTAGEDMALLHDRKAAIEEEYAKLGLVPRPADAQYKEALHQASARLAMHYDTLDFARWENYTRKLDLCSEIEKLNAIPESEFKVSSKALQELREKWKLLGPVPKAKHEEINARFLTAFNLLKSKVDAYWAKRRQEQKLSAAAKQQLVEQAEKIADSHDWATTGEAFKILQAAWKELPHAGAPEQKLYESFRTFAQKFYDARNAYFTERNRKYDTSAQTKQEIVAEAEKLSVQEGKSAVIHARKLRSEFQKAGFAGRADQELNRKFNHAMEKFFAECHQLHENREKRIQELIAELEQLGNSISDLSQAEKRFHEIQKELHELSGERQPEQAKKASQQFKQALAAARKQLLADKLTLIKTVSRPLAEAYSRLKRGEAIEEAQLTVPNLDLFPKLNDAAQLLKSASSGDTKALEKLKKLESTAKENQTRICSELEKLVDIKQNPAKQEQTIDLAAELTAAIIGNFAKSEKNAQAETLPDPEQLLNDFLNTALVDAETWEQNLERFNQAYNQLRKP